VELLSPRVVWSVSEEAKARISRRLERKRKVLTSEVLPIEIAALSGIATEAPKGQSTFDPNSARAKEGIAFQKSVFVELQEQFPGNDTFEECWDYFKAKNPELGIYELACLEKEWGDITFVHEGQRFWVECCYAMGKKSSWFCEMKRLKFKGINKWYCWGKKSEPGKTWFIQSSSWNSYVECCDRVRKGKKSFRVVPVHLIGDNLYKAKRGPDGFSEFIS
jgi:hypothetical protein